MNGTIKYKGYIGNIEIDMKACRIGIKTIGLKKELSCYVTSTNDIQSAFETTIDNYIDDCKMRGVEPEKPKSDNNTICIRLKGEVMLQLEAEAKYRCVSKNAIINMILRERYS